MNYKKKIFISIIVAVIVIFIGYIMDNFISIEFESCGSGYAKLNDNINHSSGKIELTPSCVGYRGLLSSFGEKFGLPLAWLSVSSIIFLLALLFMREAIFKSWGKFALIYIVSSIVLIGLSSPRDGGMIFYSSETLARNLIPIVYIALSGSLILSKYFKPNWKLWIVLPVSFILTIIGIILVAIVM